MTESKAFRDGVGRLLAEVQRIKAQGDYPAAKQLFETTACISIPSCVTKSWRASRS